MPFGGPDLRRAWVALTLAAAACLTAGCGVTKEDLARGGSAGGPKASKDIVMPRGAWPSALLMGPDGTLWIAESSVDAIAERMPDGTLLQHKLGEARETSIDHLAIGPDGALWFQGFEILGWLTPDGQANGYQTGDSVDIGLPSSMVAGPDGEIWFTNADSIKRLTSDGSLRTYPLEADDTAETAGLTLGPDNALWFLQSGVGTSDEDAIGRLDPDGDYRRVTLDDETSGPADIEAGPDGAMWFTARSAYAIGRVTAEGDVTSYPLDPGVAPRDITAGADDAMWFTAGRKVGRISTSGDIRLWAIPGAKDLGAIAQDPDGSFWVADAEADRVRHFTPPS